MTNPVVLLGTQANGQTLPVQVDQFGRLVAEGLQGEAGPEGPQGPQGPEGPPGNSVQLPPDPYEGALLGWLNGGLAWIGTPPVPIPEHVFGPITSIDQNGALMEVEGTIPDDIGNGVYLEQCLRDGTPYVAGFDSSQMWSGQVTGDVDPSNDAEHIFDGDLDTFADINALNGSMTWSTDYQGAVKLECFLLVRGTGNEVTVTTADGSQTTQLTDTNGSRIWTTLELPGSSANLKSITWRRGISGTYPNPFAIRINDNVLVDTTYQLNFRINQVSGQLLIGSPTGAGQFEVGKYLMNREQRVAAWLLYGNDPTSLIDHLRSG